MPDKTSEIAGEEMASSGELRAIWPCCGLIFALILPLASGLGQQQTATPEIDRSPGSTAVATPVRTPSPESVTQAFGAIPEDLAGLWLMVTQAQVAPNKVRNNFQFYRIQHVENRWTFQRLEKPKHIESLAPLIAAQAESTPFWPTERQLKKLRADREQLVTLPAYPESATFQVVHLRSKEEIPSQPPPPPAAAGAKLAIEFLERTESSTSLSAVSFYVKKMEKDRMEGDIHALTLVAGMGVVPIITPGKFVMYRIE